MNPTQSKYYQQSLSYLDSIRDKTKSHLHQPVLNNTHTPQYNIQNTFVQTTSQKNLNHPPNTPPSLISIYSDKYKSYYMESFGQDKSRQKKDFKYSENSIKPYPRFSVKEANVNSQNNNRSSILPHSPSMPEQKSLQRKRFFTVTSKSPQHSSSSSMIGQQHSLSMINQQSPISSQQSPITSQQHSLSMINPQQNNSVKESYQFAAHKLSISKVSSNTNHTPQQKSKQKRLLTQNNNQYTRVSSRNGNGVILGDNKQSKKISLKRDIISPRSEEFQQQKKKLPLMADQSLQYRQSQRHFSNLPYTSSLPEESDSFGTFKKRGNYFNQGESQLLKIQKFPSQQLFISKDVGNAIIDNTKSLQQKANNQMQINRGLREQSKQRKQQIINPIIASNKQLTKIQHSSNQTKQQTQPSVSTAKTTTIGKSSTQNILIDNDIYQDMKISRIQESTLTLQAKFLQLQKTIEALLKTDQQQQVTINQLKSKLQLELESHISLSNTNRTIPTEHNPNQIDSHHDLKRIKKELKIIKNNFELAFTSMTQQINRKLIKQQQIMKNLSEQIKTIASQNIKLSQSIQQKSSKVLQLQKSMTSFMQENQERIQNLVLLNDSYSSSANKRNRNNHSSFQYGLELKNMSGEDGGLSGREKEVVETLRAKVDSVEKEIKKMKVFHMEEKEVGMRNTNELKGIMAQLRGDLNSLTTYSKEQSALIPQLITQSMTQRGSGMINSVNQSINEKLEIQEKRFTEQTRSLRESLAQIRRSLNQQMPELRIGKLPHRSLSQNSKGQQSQQIHFPSNASLMIQRQVAQLKEKLMVEMKDRLIMSVKDKLSMIEQRLFSIEKKFTVIQQKSVSLNKCQQDCKLKELKHSGDIRELYQLVKQLNAKVTEPLSNNSTFTNIQAKLSQSIHTINEAVNSVKVSVNEINVQIQQILSASRIQTQNIQSINNQFERVINKQIIPKFHQIHSHHLQTEKKLTQLKLTLDSTSLNSSYRSQSQITKVQSIQGKINNHENYQNENVSLKKIEQYINDNINKFINTKVKLFSTKLISSKSPLLKLFPYQQTKLQSNAFLTDTFVSRQSTQQVNRQNTYLVDESGYLMDWEGVYLMEIAPDGSRTKIRLTENDIYFMEVNGISITHTQQPI